MRAVFAFLCFCVFIAGCDPYKRSNRITKIPFHLCSLLKARHVFIFFIWICGITNINAQAEWITQMGGAEGDIGNCTAADVSGHIYTIGTFSGTSAFGTYSIASMGKGDIFITQANASNGNINWVRQIGGQFEDNGTAVTCDVVGNVYFTGRFSGTVIFGTFTLTSLGGSDSFIAKLDQVTGAIIWVKKMGGTGYDGGLSVTSDPLGNVYTSGYFQGVASFGTVTVTPVGTNFNIFLACTDGASGNVLWAKGYGSAGYSFGTSVSCDVLGNVYMTGYFENDVVFGTYTLSSIQYQDVFVSKHDGSNGNVTWAYSAGGDGNDSGNGIVAGNDGYIYTTGKFEGNCAFGTTTLTSAGSADLYVSKRDALTGAVAWVKGFGAGGYEQANAITQDANGTIFVTGQFSGFVTFGATILSSSGSADIFIAEIEPGTGNVPWAIGMGGSNVDSGYGIAIGPANALYCTGSFYSAANFPGFDLTAKGITDVFIMKLNSATVGMNENERPHVSFRLIPVPFHETLTVEMNRMDSKSYTLFLTNLSGQVLMEFISDQARNVLDLKFLTTGIYFVTIREESGVRSIKRIVKQ